MKIHYFDYASARPLYPQVAEEISSYFLKGFGNPSSIHKKGREAHARLEEAREFLLDTIKGGEEGKIVFTSGATESNNLAILGYCNSLIKKGEKKKRHLITSAIEHVSVYNVFKYLEKNGFEVTYLPVDKDGFVKLHALEEVVKEETALISIMYANQEVGTIQPVKEISKIASEYNIPFHTDAAAAFGRVKIHVENDGIQMMTLSSNDVYGPQGIGALYYRDHISFEPLFQGGPQEFKKRPGTEALPLIMGFKKAVEITIKNFEKETDRLKALRDKLFKGLTEIPASFINGHPTKRVPDNVNVRFNYIEGEAMLLHLENHGILAATGSACTSDSLQASRVLTSMGIPHEEAHGSLQLTLGKDTTEEDVTHLLEVLPPIVEQLRRMSPLTPEAFFEN